WDNAKTAAAVDALYAAERFLDYMSRQYGRNGVDGRGGPGVCAAKADSTKKLLKLVVHYGNRWANAQWSGNSAQFGDADCNDNRPFVDLDIVAHELMHGVTQYTAGLAYQDQSGALNESWSDVFGTLTKRYVRGENAETWQFHVDGYTPAYAGDA